MSSTSLLKYVGLRSATALVVANVIGAGIFTTTGFQAEAIGHPGTIFLLWLAGAILAFCGALCYAELGALMPEPGAEYAYLRNTYGGVLGFMSAFVSLFAGFSAPIAAATKGCVHYLGHFSEAITENSLSLGGLPLNELLAMGLVWLLVLAQLRGARSGLRFLDALTAFKVLGLLAVIGAAFLLGTGSLENFLVTSDRYDALGSQDWYAALGTSLIFVMFCYSGWNASAYIASEFENPQRDLHRSLLLGIGIVTLLYLGMNAVYFYGASVNELAGRVEVGLVAARNLFGASGTTLVTVVLVVSLIASASAMTIAGPRVYYALGRDVESFRFLAQTRTSGSPHVALIMQGIVTSVIILSGTVDQIMQYAGFTLTLFASLAVSCVIVLRFREPDVERPFRTWGYPIPPILFIVASGWMMFWAMRARPVESMLAFLTLATAGFVFYLVRPSRPSRPGR